MVLAFFTLPEARSGAEIAALYGQFALYLAGSIAVFFTLDSLLKVSTHTLTTVFAATGFALFYWYGGPCSSPPSRLVAGRRHLRRARRGDRAGGRVGGAHVAQGARVPGPGGTRGGPRAGRAVVASRAASRSLASHSALPPARPR